MVDSYRVPADLAGWDPDADLGQPGEFPFTRGIQPTMYRGRLWTMRQYAGFGTATESNRRYRHLLAQGVTGLSVAFDLPTQMGYDSDHALAAGEVGRVGVAIDSLDDMAELFDGIPLDRVSTSMTINSTAIILLAMYVAIADRHGIDRAKLSGTVQNDILKEYLARGTFIYPPQASLRLVTDIFAFCERELPQWNAISVSGYHIREAGSTAVQEVAFTLANGIAYIEAGRARGLSAESLGERMSFFFAAHNDFLEEIAKFRAARRMWARIMKERFGVTSPRAQQLRFHAQTAGSTLTAQQPDNNLVRVTVQALAAVLGGAQSLHCNSRDEALALPTEESATLALRTQQIIAHESGVANTVDPVGGSYEIESRTNEIEHDAGAGAEPHRRCRRHARGDRIGNDPAGDSGVGVPRAASDRQRRIAGRRRHEIPDRRGHDHSNLQHRSGNRARTAGARQPRCARRAMPPRGARRSMRSATPRAATRISCRSSSRQSEQVRRSEKSRIRYERCSASIARILFSSRGAPPPRAAVATLRILIRSPAA